MRKIKKNQDMKKLRYEKHTYNNNKSTATFKQEMIITITAKLRAWKGLCHVM